MSFPDKLKFLRSTQNKETQEFLAKSLNVTRSQIAKFESGDREPDLATLNKIVKHYDVNFDYLLGNHEYDLTRLNACQQELCEMKQCFLSKSDVIFECFQRGLREFEKEIDAVNLFIEAQNEGFDLIDLPDNFYEELKNANFALFNYALHKSKDDKVLAILTLIRIWGVLNDIQLNEIERNILEKYFKFLMTFDDKINSNIT